VYYELSDYYQNHRRYMQSRSNPQLMGKRIDSVQVKTCDPIMLNSDVATPLYSYLMPKDATDEEKK
jgi:hypothetical protein